MRHLEIPESEVCAISETFFFPEVFVTEPAPKSEGIISLFSETPFQYLVHG